MRATAVLIVLLALPAVAAEKDAAYYQRTHTQPPMVVDGVIGPSINYAEGIGVGLQGGPVFHTKSAGPVYLLFSASAMRIDGVNGTVTPPPYQGFAWPHPPPQPVAYSTPDRTVGNYAVTVLFRVK